MTNATTTIAEAWAAAIAEAFPNSSPRILNPKNWETTLAECRQQFKDTSMLLLRVTQTDNLAKDPTPIAAIALPLSGTEASKLGTLSNSITETLRQHPTQANLANTTIMFAHVIATHPPTRRTSGWAMRLL